MSGSDPDFPRVVVLIDNGVMPGDQMMASITRPVEEAMKDIPGVVSALLTNTISATTNTFDAYISNEHKDRNYGGATNLIVSGDSGHEKRTLVRFDLSSIPTNATIASAGLTLTKIGGTAAAARNISVHRLTNDWTENTLNDVNGEASWNRRKTGVNWAKSGGDFASAGVGGSPYRSWLEVNGVSRTDFSESNPIRSSRVD